MSELKIFKKSVLKIFKQSDVLWGHWFTEYYLKSETDKFIAELKAQKAQAEDDCVYWKMREENAVNAMHETEEACMCLTKSERHHKYKRCLAMAEMCNARYDEEDAKVNGCGASWEYISNKMNYWERWRWRWEALAEKFEEGV